MTVDDLFDRVDSDLPGLVSCPFDVKGFCSRYASGDRERAVLEGYVTKVQAARNQLSADVGEMVDAGLGRVLRTWGALIAGAGAGLVGAVVAHAMDAPEVAKASALLSAFVGATYELLEGQVACSLARRYFSRERSELRAVREIYRLTAKRELSRVQEQSL